MKTRFTLLLTIWMYLAVSLAAQDTAIDTLDQYIPGLMKSFDTPGLSVAVVQGNKVLYSKGFGTRTINEDEQVDKNTLFAIGSISKSFTALSLAMLVDEGKIGWDDKVIRYVPYFMLYDPYVTESFTIRDLLTHRSGLDWTSGGTLWYHSDLSREDIIRRMKFLDPVSEFRTKPAYQNIMFIVASKVVEAVTNESWDDFVRNRIFKPIGMVNTVISQSERMKSRNISAPHIKDENFRIIAVEQEKLDNIAPAAAIYSSSDDMAKYMIFLLNDGVINGDTLISLKALNELFTPQIHFPIFGKPVHNEFTSYGLGWWLTPKNGNKIIEHSGGVDGMGANLIMEKTKQFGVIALSNCDYSPISFALSFALSGTYLFDKDYLGISNFMLKSYPGSDEIALAEMKKQFGSKVENTQPSLAVKKYTGIYVDEMYGDISILLDKKNLKIAFSHTPIFSGILYHWHYDTFKIDWTDPRIPEGFLTFELNSFGEVTGFTLDQPDLLDVDFSELDIKKQMIE